MSDYGYRRPGLSDLELQATLNAEHCRIPAIFNKAALTGIMV
jgi:hypothetical protein